MEARADAFLETLQHRFEPLCLHPEMGAARGHLAAGVRAVLHKRYLIYYQTTDEEIIIVRIVHGSRNITRVFEAE